MKPLCPTPEVNRRQFLCHLGFAVLAGTLLAGCGGATRGGGGGGDTLDRGIYLYTDAPVVGSDTRINGTGASVRPLVVVSKVDGFSATLYGTGDIDTGDAQVLQSVIIKDGAPLGVRILHDNDFFPTDVIDQKTGYRLQLQPSPTQPEVMVMRTTNRGGTVVGQVILELGPDGATARDTDGNVLGFVPYPDDLLARTRQEGGDGTGVPKPSSGMATFLKILRDIIGVAAVVAALTLAAVEVETILIGLLVVALLWMAINYTQAIVSPSIKKLKQPWSNDESGEPPIADQQAYWLYKPDSAGRYVPDAFNAIRGFWDGQTSGGELANVDIEPLGDTFGFLTAGNVSGTGSEMIFEASLSGNHLSLNSIWGSHAELDISGEMMTGTIKSYTVALKRLRPHGSNGPRPLA